MPRGKPLAVVALGGNAFMRRGEGLRAQRRNVAAAAAGIVWLLERGYRVVVTHGNGPQVGLLLDWAARSGAAGELGLDEAVAATQGWLGYLLQQAIGNLLEERGYPRRVATVVTQSIVSRGDQAWERPSKPIGPYYAGEEAERLAKRYGWAMMPDPRGGFRRVVPSPSPQAVAELEAIQALLEAGHVVIAAGGGGVPVVRTNHWLHGVDAVVDKDRASALLAARLHADLLAILTDVEGAYLGYGKPSQRLIHCMTPATARRLAAAGHFGEGTMKPKVEAAAAYVEETRGTAVIAELEKLPQALQGETGTHIKPECSPDPQLQP